MDLDDLPVKELPKESRKILSNGGGFFHKLPDGKKIEFKLITGADEKKAARFMRGTPDLLEVLGLRIVSIEGVDRSKKIRFLEDMEVSQHRYLIDAFDDADGGIETEIEVE